MKRTRGLSARSRSLRQFITSIVLDVLASQPAPAPRPRSWAIDYGREFPSPRYRDGFRPAGLAAIPAHLRHDAL